MKREKDFDKKLAIKNRIDVMCWKAEQLWGKNLKHLSDVCDMNMFTGKTGLHTCSYLRIKKL